MCNLYLYLDTNLSADMDLTDNLQRKQMVGLLDGA